MIKIYGSLCHSILDDIEVAAGRSAEVDVKTGIHSRGCDLESACFGEVSRWNQIQVSPGGSKCEEGVVLFDNHYPKGHHRHFADGSESEYRFQGVERAIRDFLSAVEEIKNEG